MKSLRRPRGIVQTLALALALAFPLMMIAVSAADARAGRGGSSGSRGSRTFSAPAATTTAPNAAQPFNRTMTQPGAATRAPATGAAGGFFNRPGMGMLGGLAAGFLGAGLLGMLFGGGLSSTNYAIVYGQKNYTAWSPPLWPIKVVMTAGIFLMLLQLISTFIKDVAIARGKPIA